MAPPAGNALLLCIIGTTDKIKRLLRHHHIFARFKAAAKTDMVVPGPRTKIDLEDHGVYEIRVQTVE